ncbi:MAG: hypothetical protein KGL39_36455 [Patescibacteria group bacterium]|nr:hypothetical protein [Patescibacteria group bacterium]
MAGKVLHLREIWKPDGIGVGIAIRYNEWRMLRQPWEMETREIREYLFATDTTKTTNSKLPWNNKTTIPKLCQIRDNLLAYYMAAVFPKRKWLYWEGSNYDDVSKEKCAAIENYMGWVIDQPNFKNIIQLLLSDFIDYGNCFAAAEWVDETNTLPDKTQVGYVGPIAKRYSPFDLVMNPIAPDFIRSPKIVRSLISIGEVKQILESESTPENKQSYVELWDYLRHIRNTAGQLGSADLKVEDTFLAMDGFHSYRAYLESDYAEVLTFYGDLFDRDSNTYLKNHVISVVDRHKIILKKPNPSYFGYPPIFHTGWRKRQDNLWAQSPLANLIGMQYRIDHIENLKADKYDLTAFPPLKVKGYVNDFDWAPFAKIHVGDDGDVEPLYVQNQIDEDDRQVQYYASTMEEMAGSPKEAMGFRTPGEKTAFEVQRLENASSRIFMAKVSQFEEQVLEPLLNAMLELARRNLNRAVVVPVFNPDFDISVFQTLSASDLVGSGKIKPVAARHFIEQAELIQNLSNFYNSGMGKDPNVIVHMSGYGIAKLVEDNLNLKDYGIVQENIRLSEEANARREAQSHMEQTQMEAMTPSGLTPDDTTDVQGAGNTGAPSGR